MRFNIVMMLIFAIIITGFAIINAASVTVNLFFVNVEVSLALVIIIATLIGAILVILFDMYRNIQNRNATKELKKKITEFEKQISLKDEAIKQRDIVIAQKDDLIKIFKSKIEEPKINEHKTVDETVD